MEHSVSAPGAITTSVDFYCEDSFKRLPFMMPDFVRPSWVSDEAATVWRPRFRQIISVWVQIEVLSVSHRLRPCAVVRRSHVTDTSLKRLLSAASGEVSPSYRVLQLPATSSHIQADELLAIGTSSDLKALASALRRADHQYVGALLGYPKCCQDAFTALCSDEHWLDTTWSMSAMLATSSDKATCKQTLAHITNNILWRRLGIRAVPHLPCKPDCRDSLTFGNVFFDLAFKEGFEKEIRWLREILSWPCQWSALHGIAELKTPLMKLSMNTDATDSTLRVHWNGVSYPIEGARGVAFPYTLPATRTLSSSRSYKRGMDNIVQISVV